MSIIVINNNFVKALKIIFVFSEFCGDIFRQLGSHCNSVHMRVLVDSRANVVNIGFSCQVKQTVKKLFACFTLPSGVRFFSANERPGMDGMGFIVIGHAAIVLFN